MSDYEANNRSDVKDRRIRKTRAALKKSLTTLLQHKNVKDISVKELTDLADVNRGTFYLHYKDVFDLLEQSEQDLLDEFSEVIKGIPADTIKNNRAEIFVKVYTLCKENADLVRILLGENGDIKFLNGINTFLKEACLKDWSPYLKQVEINQFDAFFSFLVGGCCSLLQYWFS
ncbi:MAG: TetR/AcrR family transcriptional regulator, partial [Eubacteriales bacterium]|nr:TetR/AcrR family transcriptional regulator [Eubacteriales bacterium]